MSLITAVICLIIVAILAVVGSIFGGIVGGILLSTLALLGFSAISTPTLTFIPSWVTVLIIVVEVILIAYKVSGFGKIQGE